MTVAIAVLGPMVALAGAALWVRRRLVAVTVYGPSMAPAFRDGDRVLVRRTGVDRLRRGQVVVIERPEPDGRWRPSSGPAPTHWMIKRVAAMPGDPVPADVATAMTNAATPDAATTGPVTVVPGRALVLLGDNAAASYDSRQVGLFPAERLLGVVVRKLPDPRGTRGRSGP
jgi:signal peptidase I